ncbi:hypothetical protein R6258_02580 [Halomonas sp. HP20-15]|uniref:hypothetical protein n=1 Tax=Halomonas sp. HP20-15 TaxID=3085901 RepID=UPI0029815332|nr:hypothetical protein [Halomonas sp. HP20-15]MDW5375797.1 hypothetical protein [Halomonas sp. HP20-15]
MRDFLLLRRPLPRRTLVFCHVVAQLTLVIAGLAWLAMRSPWLAGGSWAERWPTLVLDAGLWLVALVGLRLLAELLMLPYHLAGLRQGPGAVVTRAFDRRPAVHDPESAWVNEAKAVDPDEGVIGSPRVTRARQPLKPAAAAGDSPTAKRDGNEASHAGTRPPRQEPSL